MSRCAFLVDECLPSSVDRGLSRRVPDASVLRVVGEEDTPSIGADDQALPRFCEQQQRLLPTADRSTMSEEVEAYRAQGNRIWGVLVVRPGASLNKLLDELEVVVHVSEAEEWIDQYEFVPF